MDILVNEAEDWIIGSLLKRGDAIGELLDLVEPADFHSPRHRAAFAAAVQLARRQAPIDYGMLSEEMAVSGAMSATDALQWLADVNLRIPSAAHARHYAEIVVRYADWRRCIEVAQWCAETAYRGIGLGMLVGRGRHHLKPQAVGSLPLNPLRKAAAR